MEKTAEVKDCATCLHELKEIYNEPCKSCKATDTMYTNWVDKETANASQFKQPSALTEDSFCKLFTGYHGEEIDNIKQLVATRFSGQELFEFCKYVMEQITPPSK